MDRLVCGDVGFGKTEVAFRAMFKAVMNGRQVIMLAPTTLLAQQHYENLSRRLKDFPVNVCMLSRFVSQAQIKQNLIDQLTASVRWTQEVEAMVEAGATEFVECGPGQALTGMITKIAKDAVVMHA